MVREALILSEKGAEVKSYAAAGQALLLLLIVPAYGYLASRVNRIKLITAVTLLFIINLLIFYMAGAGGTHVGVAFFLWVGIFNTLVVAQFWGLANDFHSEEQGKRLFPMVGVRRISRRLGSARNSQPACSLSWVLIACCCSRAQACSSASC